MNPKRDYSPNVPPSVIRAKTTAGPAPEGMGTGLFASTNIQANEDVIYSKSPLVAVVETAHLADTCSWCFGRRQLLAEADGIAGDQHGIELKRCVGCRAVKYCDKVYVFVFFLWLLVVNC